MLAFHFSLGVNYGRKGDAKASSQQDSPHSFWLRWWWHTAKAYPLWVSGLHHNPGGCADDHRR